MLDLNVLLNDTENTADRLAAKGTDPSSVFAARDSVLHRRQLRARLDDLRAEMNRRSKEMGQLVASAPEQAAAARERLVELKQDIANLEKEYREADAETTDLLLRLPNLPSAATPVGRDESANVVIAERGPAAERRPDARPHWEVGTDLGIIDVDRAAKLSGSGFSVLRGDGARLLRGLVQFGLDLHRDNYVEMVVPHFVRGEIMVGTGHLPKFQDDAYSTKQDDLWLIPTGEVPLTGLHRDEILDADQLPLKYVTHTSCFRREAGSAGKDTRGMQRLHEFHKVELVKLCLPENVEAEFDALLADAELALQRLNLPYRLVELCTGDITFSSARIIDLEVYSPGVDKWLEVSSVGNFTDFQARRGNIRYRTAEGGTQPVCTLNGSAVATPRLWAAVIEHGQQADGSVVVPEALVPYLGKEVIQPSGR